MTKHDEAVQVAARDRLFAAELAAALDVPVAAVQEPEARASRTAWLAAAIVLLGVFVAGGVAWLRAREDATAAQEPAVFDPVFPWYERFPSSLFARGAEVLASLSPVTSLYIRLPDDKSLAFLERQRELRHFSVMNPGRVDSLTEDAWRTIGALPKLETLGIHGVEVTANNLRELRAAPRLHSLDLSAARAHLDAGLGAALVELPKLRMLATGGAVVTIEGIEALAGLPHLEFLHLGQVHIDDATIAAIAKLRTLRVLGLYGVVLRGGSKTMPRLSGQQVRVLGQLPRLLSLQLSCLTVDDESLASLPPTLQSLSIGDVDGITEAGLQSVAKLQYLRALSLEKLGSDPAMRAATVHLVRTLKLERFDTPNAEWPADLWAAVAEQARLRCLHLRCPDVGGPDLSSCASMPALEQLRLWMPKSLVPADLAPLKQLPRFRSLVVRGTERLPAGQREALVDCLGPGVTVHLR